MAPHSSAVHIRLAEPVVFLRNLDSATDRRERRAQRRRAQQAADALLRAEGHAPQQHNGEPHEQAYVPPSGRGGAGSRSRDRSSSQARARSASRGGGHAGASPSRNTPSSLHPNEAPSADSQQHRGRSPAPRRETLFAPPSAATGSASPPRPPASPFYTATPNVDNVIQQAPPPLPLVDVPVVQPENTDIGLTRPPAIIRGVMTVHFSKPTRVKKIGIRLKGQSKTEWPEGLGPRRLDTAERNTLIDETVLFFDATSSSASQSRRAASVGPGATISHRDASIITPEAFEHGTRAALASSASRSASMMPSTRAFQDPGPSRQPAAVAGASARAPLMDAQRTVTAPATPPITGAPISESPSEQHNPPLYSPVPESIVSDTPDRLTGASVAVADAPRSPAPEPSLLPSPLSPRSHSPRSHSQSLSSQLQNQVASSSASTDPSRPIPHEHFQDRAAELRAQALAMSPPSTPAGELSPAASRASSLYDRPLATHAPVQGGSTDNSRPPSVASSAETPETPATTSSRLRHHRESISTVDTPSTSEIPLSQTETNASMISLSSSSDHEGTSSLEEQRGRSQLPVNRNRERELLTNQTIMEDGPQEAYLDSLNGNHDQSVSPGPVSPRRPPLSVETAQASHAYSDGMGSTATGASQSSSVTPATGTRQGSGLPSSARRSSSAASSHTISSHTPKTARFSLSSLMHRDKSSSRTRRSASPESMLHGKRNHSTSRTRGNGLQAIKNALTGHHDKDGHMVTTHVTHTPISSEAESDSDDEHGRRGRSGSRSMKWQEFKAGSYNFPIYFPIPLSLPPTIHANHGQVTYMLKGFVNRAGALTTNLHTVTEVHVVAAPHEDDLEAIESIIVERMWETQLNYKIVIHCKSAPIGGQIPVTIRLNPLSKMKLFRLTAILEEKFTIYAKERKLSRNEPVRRYDLVRIQKPDNAPMLPIISDDPDAIAHSPLKDWIHDATTTEGTGIQTMSPDGPWVLESNIPVPDCTSALQFSTSHEKANISVIHSLKIIMRVERGDDEYLDSKGDRKKFDIIVEAPMHILSCRTAAVNALPTYTTSPSPMTNPFDAEGEISIDSSAFHPHELSDNERHTLHYRGGSGVSMVPHRGPHNRHHPGQSMSAAITGVSDSQLQEALLQGGGVATTSDPPPPSYEYVETHPQEGTRAPILAMAV